MRFAALFLALIVSASAADVKIVRVFTGWRDASSFKRISEYFTGVESTGGQIVIRTQPAERGGFYFLVRTANAGAPFDAVLSVAVVTPDSTRPRVHTFRAQVPGGRAVFNLGVTGPDWTGGETEPMAWKIEIAAADGSVLATKQSYLWEMPDSE